MNNYIKKSKYWKSASTVLLLGIVFLLNTNISLAQVAKIGTSKVWGNVDGIAIEGVVQGPSAQVSDLQVACVFEYTEGDIYNSPPALPAELNGLVHLDKDTKGLLTDLRKSGRFAGRIHETILISPPKGMIGGKRLLLIGLGDRTKFSPEIMVGIGSVAMRSALELGVDNFAFASDLKDAGVDSPTALVAGNAVKGIFQAYKAQLWLKEKKMSSSKRISKVILLAGPAFFNVAGEGIQDAIKSITELN